jgi:hypothetical protein
LKNKPDLKKFICNHNEKALTDECLVELGKCEELHTLSINFCKGVTSAGFEGFHKQQFVELGLASLPGLKAEDFARLITQSG